MKKGWHNAFKRNFITKTFFLFAYIYIFCIYVPYYRVSDILQN